MAPDTTDHAPVLDHMVVNVQLDMDPAAEQFAALGFTLTPRGFHSLGSINHLMMFGTDYLELIGLPAGAEGKRPEISNAPRGLNGLVFKTPDVNATYAHLLSVGMAGDRPHSFSRPVEVDGRSQDACFSTVSVRAGIFPEARVYFCQHHTPELVWRAQWQQHANGVKATRAFVVLARDPAEQAEQYARLLGRTVSGSDGALEIDLNGPRLQLLAPEAYQERFGAQGVALSGSAGARFGALSLQTSDLGAATDALRNGAGATIRSEPDRTLVRVDAFDTVLELVG